MLAPIILKWPGLIQSGESAPALDFNGAGDAWIPAKQLLLTAEKPAPVNAGCGGEWRRIPESICWSSILRCRKFRN